MTERRRVAILGATGSIGRQAIDVVRAHRDDFEVVGLVAGSDEDALRALAAELDLPDDRIGLGDDAAVDLATHGDADVVLNAIVGAAGLRASVAALAAGTTLALANKESLVAGGEVCRRVARTAGTQIVPVDSEHSALAQCLHGVDRSNVRRVVLTASGGPFRTRSDLSDVTPDEALVHPTWSMGPKITVDSATLMNKGLEIIEAHFLFDIPYDDIDVLVHPQSVVHGLAELVDGSVVMSAAAPDMRIPIQAALSWPARIEPAWRTIDLATVGEVSFERVDRGRFPAVDLAYEAGRRGRSYPAVLNAANEVAVRAFLDGELDFLGIPRTIEATLAAHSPRDADTLDIVLEVDAWARGEARSVIVGKARGPLGVT